MPDIIDYYFYYSIHFIFIIFILYYHLLSQRKLLQVFFSYKHLYFLKYIFKYILKIYTHH